MNYFNLDNKIARLIILQRIELASNTQKRLRKILGRYIFTNIITKYFISKQNVSKKYYRLMLKEYDFLSQFIDFNKKKILSIGSGMCGLELMIKSKNEDSSFTIIEKNYVSSKVKYGWDIKNDEAYNDLDLLKKFLLNNGFKKDYRIFDFDKNNLPEEKFDIIISLYSLDYHYDFYFYLDYLKKVMDKKTLIVFDTIRPNFFEKIFNHVKIISSDDDSVHNSKRVICTQLLN